MNTLEKANSYIEKHKIEKEELPSFHVTGPVGWINDPNGFSFFGGDIHLFYQFHPYSEKWGPMHWGHCRTRDMIKWEQLPVALAPDQVYDGNGCFSGSGIEVDGKHLLAYTGVMEDKLPDGKTVTCQNQCIAMGDGLVYNKAVDNPVITGAMLPEGFSGENFRDPKIWEDDGQYFLVAAALDGNGLGQIVMFQSGDLSDWTYLGILAGNDGNYGTMWECPDFFELDGQHVLIASPQYMTARDLEFHNGNNSVYMLGEYDKLSHKFNYGKILSVDYGFDFYAPQTTKLPDGRRIMIGWMQSWDGECRNVDLKWNGMMTIPRELFIENGQLIQKPVKELENYRKNPVLIEACKVHGEEHIKELDGRLIDMTIDVPRGDYHTFTIKLAANEKYHTDITYKPEEQLLIFDRTYSGITRDVSCTRMIRMKDSKDSIKLRIIMDRYSVEVFVNDGKEVFSFQLFAPFDADGVWLACDKQITVSVEKYDIWLEATASPREAKTS